MKARGLGQARLGRGEGSIGSRELAGELLAQAESEVLEELPIDAIQPNPWQCRMQFRDDALQELANAIARDGLLHPLVVRSVGDGLYQLAAGERRFRSVVLLGWKVVPVRVCRFSDREMRRVAWSENMLRDDLTAWEQAQAVLAAQHELDRAGDPSHQRAVAEELGISLGSTNELLRVARAFSARLVERAEGEGKTPPREGPGSTKAVSIHDIPRGQLVRAAKLDTEAERDAWLSQRLEDRGSKSPRRPPRTSVSVPLDPTSCSPSRAREVTLTLLAILPELIRRGASDPTDARALGTAAAAYCLERFGGPAVGALVSESDHHSDTEGWLRELRRRGDQDHRSKPTA